MRQFFLTKKKNSMLACRVVCCSHQSDRRNRVCISHQSVCRIRVCISHKSYHCIWISCTNHFGAFGYYILINDVMESGGCAQRMTLTGNFGLRATFAYIFKFFIKCLHVVSYTSDLTVRYVLILLISVDILLAIVNQ